MTNIILIGFMGAGKTTVAKQIASCLKKTYIEVDELVRKESGRKSIKEIFEKDGEETFRALEEDVARTLASAQNAVISTGGGVVMNERIMKMYQKLGSIVFLDVPFEEVALRVKKEGGRPLFEDKKRARELYYARLPFYRTWADITIQGKHTSPEKIAKEIEENIAT